MWKRPAAGRTSYSKVVCGSPLWAKFNPTQQARLIAGMAVSVDPNVSGGTRWRIAPESIALYTEQEVEAAFLASIRAADDLEHQDEQPFQQLAMF